MVRMTHQSRLHLAVGSLLGLWTTLSGFRLASGLTSDLGCPTETVFCLADGGCSSCLDALQSNDVSIDPNFADCTELFASVCGLVEGLGCDVTNDRLLDFAGCVAEDQFGCADFSTCAEATAEVGTDAAATMPPTDAAATMPPTDAAATMPPTVEATAGATLGATAEPTTGATPAAVGLTASPTAGASPAAGATDRGIQTEAPATAEELIEAGSGGVHTVAAPAMKSVLTLTIGLALVLTAV